MRIDVSNALTFEQALANAKRDFESGVSDTNSWMNLGISEGKFIVPTFPTIRYSPGAPGNNEQQFLKAGKLRVYWNHIAYCPDEEWRHTVKDTTFRMRSADGYSYVAPTVFDLDVSSTIYLDDSYCAVGIHDFDIVQKNGKTAIVYDKNGNLMFDGTQKGDGVYHFKCSMTDYVPRITLASGTVKTCNPSYSRSIYTGSNEEWMITKAVAVS